MRKAKSRNFILIVCGVLITFLLGFVVAKTIFDVIEEVNSKDNDEELQRNILSSSSKIKLSGKGNFIDSTPKLEKTMISDFNIKLNEYGDEVYYSLTFCNMNKVDMIYEDLAVEALSCRDSAGNSQCNNVLVDSYVLKHKKELEKGSYVSANSCVDVVIDAKYISDVPSETEVTISRVVLELGGEER